MSLTGCGRPIVPARKAYRSFKPNLKKKGGSEGKEQCRYAFWGLMGGGVAERMGVCFCWKKKYDALSEGKWRTGRKSELIFIQKIGIVCMCFLGEGERRKGGLGVTWKDNVYLKKKKKKDMMVMGRREIHCKRCLRLGGRQSQCSSRENKQYWRHVCTHVGGKEMLEPVLHAW